MRKIIWLLLMVILIWALWSRTGRVPAWDVSESHLSVIQEIKADSLSGYNIVAVQPYMTPDDYLSEAHFYRKLKTYFEVAREEGFFREDTMILLPEYLGTWLVVAGEKRSVARRSTITGAMTTIVLSNPFRFLRHFLISDEEDRSAAAIFRMKSGSMAEIYERVFGRLAREYGVTIIAGSIVLPDPTVQNGSIQTNKRGPVYNVTFVFHPDGNPDPNVIKKIYPIESELPFVKPAPLTELEVFDLPAGRTGILVCADSWYPEVYEHLRSLQTEIVLVNSYCAIDGSMQARWQGYSGADNPFDVNPEDIGALTEEEAWHKYALPGRFGHSGARVGVNTFLRGELWDLGTDGQPFIILDEAFVSPPAGTGAGIWNIRF